MSLRFMFRRFMHFLYSANDVANGRQGYGISEGYGEEVIDVFLTSMLSWQACSLTTTMDASMEDENKQ